MMRTSLLLGFLCFGVLASPGAVAADSKVDTENVIDEATKLSEQASSAYEQRKVAEAERLWRLIIEKHSTSTQFGLAQYNVGYILQEQGKYDSAIVEYQKLFPSKVNDKDPGANIMEAYRNYRNKAAKQISACYEKKGQNRQALDWAIQGRDKYPYQTWCGTCADQEKKATDANIARLQRLVDATPQR